MFAIKEEFEKNVCRGCLSTNRNPVILKSHVDLFFNLLGDQQQFCETKILLCWECKALLKRIQLFQNRIQQAQFILQQSLYTLENLQISNLSTLTTTKKDYYDNTIEYEEVKIDENVTIDETKEIIDNFIKQETDLDNDDIYDDFKLENVDEESVASYEKNYQDGSKERRHSIKKYVNKAVVIDTGVMSDPKKYCSKVYLSEREIEDEYEKDMNSIGFENLPYKCQECKKGYKKELYYKRHYTFEHVDRTKKRLNCVMCKGTFPNFDALKQHWRRYTKHYACTLCGWSARANYTLMTHIRRTHACLYNCKRCEGQFRTLREFSNHYKNIHERIICDNCGKSFVKKRTLEIHIKRHHAPATCYICKKTYSHYHVLENHYRLNHPQFLKGDTRTELAYCVECDKQFPSIYKYKRHLMSAAKHRPPKRVSIPCPECGKLFARKVRMTNHYHSVHVNDSKHRCDICNKSFCSAYSARTHRQCVHEKIPLPKNKMCDICGRGFSTNRILINHRRTHTGERPYACAHCPATFAQLTAMKTHEKTQHKTTTHM